MISGNIRVTRNCGLLDDWQAPELIGELAPMMHKRRSANVTATEGGVAYIKISGPEFRQLYNDHPSLRVNLEARKDSMLQARIAQNDTLVQSPSWQRMVGAVAAGAASFLATSLVVGYFSIGGSTNFMSAAVIGLTITFMTLVFSAAWIVRATAVTSALTATGVVSFGIPHVLAKLDSSLAPGSQATIGFGQAFTGSEAVAAMLVLAVLSVTLVIDIVPISVVARRRSSALNIN